MGTYPLSWSFYLSFIFFAAHDELLLQKSDAKKTQLDDIQAELDEIKTLLHTIKS